MGKILYVLFQCPWINVESDLHIRRRLHSRVIDLLCNIILLLSFDVHCILLIVVFLFIVHFILILILLILYYLFKKFTQLLFVSSFFSFVLDSLLCGILLLEVMLDLALFVHIFAYWILWFSKIPSSWIADLRSL